MLPQRILVEAIAGAVRRWPTDHARWWRKLLNTDPHAAIVLGELALWLDAEPAAEPPVADDEQLELFAA